MINEQLKDVYDYTTVEKTIAFQVTEENYKNLQLITPWIQKIYEWDWEKGVETDIVSGYVLLIVFDNGAEEKRLRIGDWIVYKAKPLSFRYDFYIVEDEVFKESYKLSVDG